MGFFSRVKALFSANVNALVEKAEDPLKALDQLVRDMDAQARPLKAYLSEAIVNMKRLENDHAKHESLAQQWEQKARQILSGGQAGGEKLAREALVRKRENDQLAKQFGAAATKQRAGVEMLTRNLKIMHGRIEEAKAKKRILTARGQLARTQQNMVRATNAMTGGRAGDELKRLEEQVRDIADRADVDAELDGRNLDRQLEDLKFNGEIDLELEELKQALLIEEEPKRKLLK